METRLDYCLPLESITCTPCEDSIFYVCSLNDQCCFACKHCSSEDVKKLDTLFHTMCRKCLRKKIPAKELVAFIEFSSDENFGEEIDRINRQLGKLRTDFRLKIFTEDGSMMEIEEEIARRIAISENPAFTCFLVISHKLGHRILEKVIGLVMKYRVHLMISNTDLTTYDLVLPLKHEVLIAEIIRESSENGKILVNLKDIKKGLGRMMKTNIEKSVIKGPFRIIKHQYLNQTPAVTLVSMLKSKMDAEILRWSIAALESCNISPFLYRVKDVIEQTFCIESSDDKILRLYERLIRIESITPTYISSNTILSLRTPLCSESAGNSEKQLKSTTYFTEFCQLIEIIRPKNVEGLYNQLIYYSNAEDSLVMKLELRELYEYIETHLCIPPPDIEKVRSTLDKLLENNSMEIHQLEVAVGNQLHPHPLNISCFGYNSFAELICSQNKYALSDGIVWINKDNALNECPVCFFPMDENKCSFRCKHYFHISCLQSVINNWKKMGIPVKCPTCLAPKKNVDITSILKLKPKKKRKRQRKKKNPEHFSILKIPGVRKCLTLSCSYAFDPDSETHYKCPLCFFEYCLLCSSKKSVCTCRSQQSKEMKMFSCLKCKSHILYLRNNDYAVCNSCSTVHCIRCKLIGSQCRCQ